MDIDNIEKVTPKKKRLNLKDSATARKTLCTIMRLYHNDQIDHTKFRNLVYAFSKLLEHDRFMNDCAVNSRLETLEHLIQGEGQTIVDPKELDSPYAVNLREQLDDVLKMNDQLTAEIMELKLRLNRAGSGGETDAQSADN
jgi:hypothetical protein